MPRWLLAAVLVTAACADDGSSSGAGDGGGGPAPDRADGAPPDGVSTDPPPAAYPRACPRLYGQELFPTFEIEIEPEEWDALHEEFVTWRERQEAGLEVKPYHPLIAFRYGTLVVTDAMIRLRGNPCCSWANTDKMQFQISFNELDPDGRFLGLRKLLLDGPRYNRTYLRDRLAYAILRDAGMPAPCANNARLVVNGEYYGLYTNIEKVDREFLERNFPDPDGNLYKKGRRIETNEESADTSRVDRFWDTYEVGALSELLDLEQAVAEWAAEAMIPDSDGYWSGGGNFYTYDDPARGKFVFIPWDFDSAFEVLPPDTDPMLWQKVDTTGRPHFAAVMAESEWSVYFVDSIERHLAAYDEALLLERVDAWAAQIREAAETDPHRPFTFDSHLRSLENLRAYVGPRADYLRRWIAEQRGEDNP